MHFLSLVLVFAAVQRVSCDSAFRFGAVLSSAGKTKEMAEAKNGYELYFNKINSENEGRGFFLEGKPNTAGFYFHYSFQSLDDHSDLVVHTTLVKQLLEKERVHFLGGSHADYAAEEMRLAEANGVLNYQCCVEPDVFYERVHKRVFGITASNRDYTKNFVRALQLAKIGRVAIVYQEDDILARTTCEAAIKYFEETRNIRDIQEPMWTYKFDRSTVDPSFFQDAANGARNHSVEAVVACVYPENGKQLVNAFHDISYPLKSFFLTLGPTHQEWVDSFTPSFRSNDLFSATQWHRNMKYRDSFFRSTLDYSEIYSEEFGGRTPTYIAAAASAVGLTLTQAIREAFRSCDISRSNGDADVLLYNSTAIVCDDRLELQGYDRVIEALEDLDLETFFGRVKFNYFKRNVGLETVTTQVSEKEAANGLRFREINSVMPVSRATVLPKFPATNCYKEDCEPGYFVGPDPFDPCVACARGEASHRVNSDHCDSCPPGEWNDRVGQADCKRCPNGTMTEVRGARKITDCLCKPGYYNAEGEAGIPCAPCPEGALCAGGTAAPVPLFGYWTNATSRGSVYPCDPKPVCIGGSDFACETGYTGRLCAECEEGYFSAIQECYKCFHSALIVLLSLGLLIGWYVINAIVSRSVASLEMILAWAQLANIIGDINLNWTKKVTTLFGIANLLDFDVDILEPSCLFTWGFRQNFIVQLCLPFIMSFMAASGYFNSTIAYIVMVKNQWIQLEGRPREILSLFVKVPQDEESLLKKWDITIATFLASVDIMYVTIAKYCFDVFKCEDIAGMNVLRVDPSVVCSDGSDHRVLVGLAVVGIIFFVVGYPLYMSWKLIDLSGRSAFSNPINLRRYGFIYEKYEPDYPFTPAVVLSRKLLFVLVLVYVNNPAFQVGTLALLSIISLMIHVYTTPYVDTYLDVLFSFLLVTLMCEAFGGLMFYSENLPEADREILEWILITTVIVLTVVFLAIFVMELIKKYHIRYLKREHKKYNMRQFGPINSFFGLRTNSSIMRSLKTDSLKGSVELSFELLDTFKPGFVYDSIRNQPQLIQKWDRLTNMLKCYMSDQSETSYLSMDPIAKFWRKLVDRFPELVDFLAVTDDETREKFYHFATNLYRNFYLTNKVMPLPLMDILNWRDYAPMAQWLAIAPSEDRQFFVTFIAEMFRAAGDEDSADVIESRLKHGGTDPELEDRMSEGTLSNKKKRILHSLRSGSHPFYHSAAEGTLKTVSKLSFSLSRIRASFSRLKSHRSPELLRTHTAMSDGIPECLPPHSPERTMNASRSLEPRRRVASMNPREFHANFQALQMSRSVTFSVKEDEIISE